MISKIFTEYIYQLEDGVDHYSLFSIKTALSAIPVKHDGTADTAMAFDCDGEQVFHLLCL